ncbi:hypothetical protein HRG_001570 [Hirsutella rhossiliensis]|uniref:Allergen Asp f 4 n=1 Tax=Hirsutella rhossiliensis TaxID=111463 RepID=A0A9P8N580_9HYPO|nr:uncharacterized protein HRG_01570 [Hirsutella rhossiliensis]KAH0966161.1 hypothetical protein HRG_01570 [Hirsutella rhossiliensis]
MKLSSKALLAVLLGAGAYPGVHARFELHHKHNIFLKSIKAETQPPAPLAPAPLIESQPITTPAATTVSVAESDSARQDPVSSKERHDLAPTEGQPRPEPSSNSNSCSQLEDSPVLQAFEDFCVDPKLSKRRASREKIGYVGNIGCPGKYGSNMRLVAKDIIGKYEYTANIMNAVLSFHLAKGETKHVAFQADTQGICGCAAGSVPRWSPGAPDGQANTQGLLATTWFEFDFASKDNGGHSGIDVSSLVPTDHGFAVQGLQACKGTPCDQHPADARICSTLFSKQAGDKSLKEGKDASEQGENAFGKGTHDEDGLGPNMQLGPATVQVYVDYQHQKAINFNGQSCENEAA